MFAVYDNNPYPPDSISSRIWDRNKEMGTGRISSASTNEKFILYLYIMGTTIKDIKKMSGRSGNSVNVLLERYHVKLDS